MLALGIVWRYFSGRLRKKRNIGKTPDHLTWSLARGTVSTLMALLINLFMQ
jgi:hypothetical protein